MRPAPGEGHQQFVAGSCLQAEADGKTGTGAESEVKSARKLVLYGIIYDKINKYTDHPVTAGKITKPAMGVLTDYE